MIKTAIIRFASLCGGLALGGTLLVTPAFASYQYQTSNFCYGSGCMQNQGYYGEQQPNYDNSNYGYNGYQEYPSYGQPYQLPYAYSYQNPNGYGQQNYNNYPQNYQYGYQPSQQYQSWYSPWNPAYENYTPHGYSYQIPPTYSYQYHYSYSYSYSYSYPRSNTWYSYPMSSGDRW